MRMANGCVKLGSASLGLSNRQQIALIHEGLALGVTIFDTADAYGNGASETVLGRALRGRRDSATIATKAGYLFRERSSVERHARKVASRVLAHRPSSPARGDANEAPAPGGAAYEQQDFTPDYLRSALHASLRRLGTDYVDVFQLHGPHEVGDDTIAALADLRQDGTIRAFGVGAESLDVGAAAVEAGFDAVQIPFGVLDPWAAATVLGSAGEHGTEVWVRAVLGGGVLSAAMKSPAAPQHEKGDVIAGLREISDSAGMQLDELAVRWVSGHEEVDVMVLGMTTPAHLRRNVALGQLPPLPSDVSDRVAGVVARLGTEGGAPS